MESEKIVLTIIITLIISILILIGVINYFININNKQQEESNGINIEGDGGPYDEKYLDNFNFKIIDLTSYVKGKVKNKEQFTKKLKEYIYLNRISTSRYGTLYECK